MGGAGQDGPGGSTHWQTCGLGLGEVVASMGVHKSHMGCGLGWAKPQHLLPCIKTRARLGLVYDTE